MSEPLNTKPRSLQPVCDALIQKHGAGNAAAIEKGVQQAARLWRFSDPPIVVRSNRDLNPHVYDGDFNDFRNFCEKEFLPPGPARDATFERLENMFESLDGSFNAIRRDLHRGADLEIGPMLPIDERLGAFDASAHLDEDLYQSKIAFIVLLNFPLTTLGERLEHGMQWSRDDWAKARIARRFETRTPAEVNQAVAIAVAEAESYIAGYNIYMHRLVGEDGQHLFPEGLRLITHWGLRDELKARYADPQGLAKQRMIQKVMERIVTQTIPRAMVDGDKADWDPYKNTVAGAESPREPDTRYARWKGIFDANRMADAYDLDCPTYVQRKFEREREIPEKEVERLFLNLLESPLTPRVAAMIEKKLGRGLEPFDIWYAGFRPLSKYSEADLDAKTRAKYPNPRAYAADMPRLFVDLGFREEKARFLAGNIIVDPSRGAGHALGAQRRDDKAHLRTRFGEKGMDYKGYNIAIHEMGHNVEQSFSMTTIDHTSLSGVPNTAFTEALAFVFQARDLELLGLEKPDAEAVHAKALEDFWAAREIAGVALVDTAAWHWLYNHPAASPAEFREAVVTIANDVWNRYYAQYLGAKDVPILAVYSHMVDAGLYTPDYPLGHLIAFQIEEHFKKKEISSQLNQPLPKNFGDEFERVAKIGSLTPDAWMRTATGGPLSTEPLLTTAARAADYFENKK